MSKDDRSSVLLAIAGAILVFGSGCVFQGVPELCSQRTDFVEVQEQLGADAAFHQVTIAGEGGELGPILSAAVPALILNLISPAISVPASIQDGAILAAGDGGWPCQTAIWTVRDRPSARLRLVVTDGDGNAELDDTSFTAETTSCAETLNYEARVIAEDTTETVAQTGSLRLTTSIPAEGEYTCGSRIIFTTAPDGSVSSQVIDVGQRIVGGIFSIVNTVIKERDGAASAEGGGN
jgi:hypothetical protein